MYNANVSWEAMQDNLRILTLAGLVIAFGSKNRRKYEITAKGERLVVSYEEIIGTITSFMNETTPVQIAPALVS